MWLPRRREAEATDIRTVSWVYTLACRRLMQPSTSSMLLSNRPPLGSSTSTPAGIFKYLVASATSAITITVQFSRGPWVVATPDNHFACSPQYGRPPVLHFGDTIHLQQQLDVSDLRVAA
jgi:hypothetical protein